MQKPTDAESRSPPEPRGIVTHATLGPDNDTAQPSLTSGLHSLLEMEYALQAATECSVGVVTGKHAGEIDRILQHQLSRLGANVALLEQRYEPRRLEHLTEGRELSRPPAKPRRIRPPDKSNLLPELIIRHTRLLAKIGELVGSRPDGQRGELILAEVGRAHEAMTGVLTAMLEGEGSEDANSETIVAEDIWDNEGGHPVRD